MQKWPLDDCPGAYTKMTGLHCAHKINDIRVPGLSLLSSHFHIHWFWDRYSALASILELLRIVSYVESPSSRLELIHKRCLAEKEAWLIDYPGVQRAQHRTARGLESYSKWWYDRNRRYLPAQRPNLQTETLEGHANQTDEEMYAYLDHEAQKQQEID